MLEELERHTSAAVVSERVLLLTLLRVIGVVAVVIPSSKLCESKPIYDCLAHLDPTTPRTLR